MLPSREYDTGYEHNLQNFQSTGRIPLITKASTLRNRLRHGCIAALLACLIAVVVSQDTKSGLAAVTSVELFEPLHYSTGNLYGSRAGGTRLRLVGNDLLNPDGSFDTSIVVTVGGRPATLIPFLSTSTQLVIDTPV